MLLSVLSGMVALKAIAEANTVVITEPDKLLMVAQPQTPKPQ